MEMSSGEMNPSPLSSPVVELLRASKAYRMDGNLVYAVREADLVLTKGSFTAIVGRSGCGKSTLLNLAGAVDLPTSGEVRIGQLSTRELNDDELSRLRRTRIGFVFQFFNLLPTLRVAENVGLPLLLGLGRSAAAERAAMSGRVMELLEMVGLADRAAYFPHQLSGGEMQRVAIARALVHRPALVIADEPTGNLDSFNSDIVLRLLRRITEEMGHTVLMATHSKEAADFATRVLSMRDGQVADS
jgi:putative ABC transport system ATP-binding protein